MKILLLILLLLLQVSCATRYVIPGNRFMTPETHGGQFLAGQIEVQQTAATEALLNVDNNGEIDGVVYSEKSKGTGFLFSNSIFERLDLIWSHTGHGNSLFGAKFQLIGDPRATRSEGHKFAISAAFGGNEHELDDKSLEFRMDGKEYMAMYGYRFNQYILLYSSFSHAAYEFSGTIKSSYSMMNGVRPQLNTTARGLYGGGEFSFYSLFLKVEGGLQQVKTTDTKDYNHFLGGFSIGFSW